MDKGGGVNDDWTDAGLRAWRCWQAFAASSTPLGQAHDLRDLQDAMSDLASWLPQYDARIGDIPDDDAMNYMTAEELDELP